jgi:hypothetical protein
VAPTSRSDSGSIDSPFGTAGTRGRARTGARSSTRSWRAPPQGCRGRLGLPRSLAPLAFTRSTPADPAQRALGGRWAASPWPPLSPRRLPPWLRPRPARQLPPSITLQAAGRQGHSQPRLPRGSTPAPSEDPVAGGASLADQRSPSCDAAEPLRQQPRHRSGRRRPSHQLWPIKPPIAPIGCCWPSLDQRTREHAVGVSDDHSATPRRSSTWRPR